MLRATTNNAQVDRVISNGRNQEHNVPGRNGNA